MNLNNLKPAWRQFLLLNSMGLTDKEEILLILESTEAVTLSKTNRVLICVSVFIVLTFCCQAG